MQISITFLVEGNTDVSFLQNIIMRTFEDMVFDCRTQLDIGSLNQVDKVKGQSFVTQVLKAAEQSVSVFGAHIFCVHADADNKNVNDTMANKINPARAALAQTDPNVYCHNFVAIIPIQETEAWMLSDKDLFKQQLGTSLGDSELDINRPPESIADPKKAIVNAIRIAQQGHPKKSRQRLTIADLYEPIGAKIDLDSLRTLSSFKAFEKDVRTSLEYLKLL